MLNRLIKLAVTVLLVVASLAAQAQLADTQAPTLVYRAATTGGPAGELQTFVARASDESGLRSVALFYRQDPAAAYQRIEMRRLFDSIDEYMIAVETSRTASARIDYYLVATDKAGNLQGRGSLAEPLALELLPPAAPVAQSSPVASAPVAEPTTRPVGWIIGAVALLAVVALAGGGSDSGSNSGDTVPLTIFSPTPNQ